VGQHGRDVVAQCSHRYHRLLVGSVHRLEFRQHLLARGEEQRQSLEGTPASDSCGVAAPSQLKRPAASMTQTTRTVSDDRLDDAGL